MGRRIINKETTASTKRSTLRDIEPSTGQYWNRLKDLVPTEVSALYVAGQGVVPAEQRIALAVWAIFCLIGTVLLIANQTKTAESMPNKKYPIDWTHVAISSISFLIWVYALGGPFASLGIYVPWLATLMMLAWTFITPFVYKGTEA